MGYTGAKTSKGIYNWGVAVTTSPNWVDTDGGSSPHDLSFIKLSAKFDGNDVDNIFDNWHRTPVSQKAANLGVVGYPGDIMDEHGERGAKMYEMFQKTDYNLAATSRKMLQYQIDTYGGNSGSPVFEGEDSLNPIGVHVLGGYQYNSASVIFGPYGNRFLAYRKIAQALDGNPTSEDQQPDSSKRPWLYQRSSTTEESQETDPIFQGLKETSKMAYTVHSNVPSKILDFDQDISYGKTIGPLIGILSSAAITAAGRLAADSRDESNVESLAETRPYDGLVGRAILAECALQCFINQPKDQQESLAPFLGPIVAALKPFITKVAPRLLKGIVEPSMRLILASTPGVTIDKGERPSHQDEKAETAIGFGRELTDKEQKFLDSLMEQVGKDGDAVEAFFPTIMTIGQVIGEAFKKAGPVLADVARIGLPLLLETETGGSEPQKTYLDPLAHRAMLAEACLQTFIEAEKGVQLPSHLFRNMVKYLKELGPPLIRSSPFVAKFVGPIVADILRELNNKKRQQEFMAIGHGK
ncbi:hypothetical protein F5Y03DRAFT_369033 [Xylaria venustula]|nr:hypothetical protein F5Y03DRAFT_369033 [Xylaria venustula]